MQTPSLTRYRRQTAFAPFGSDGQEMLRNSTVLICGCGALGSMVANLLCRAGVGTLKLVDFDDVQLDNLHRQLLFEETDAKEQTLKVEAAARVLTAANHDVRIEPIPLRLTDENKDAFVEDVDLLIDGTDNFRTRFLLNRIAVERKIPLISAGVLGSSGQVVVVIPGRTPCLECLMPADECPDSNRLDVSGMEEYGILGPTVSFTASLQAMEALKILSGNTDAIQPGLLSFDLWTNRFTQFGPLSFREKCPVCQLPPPG